MEKIPAGWRKSAMNITTPLKRNSFYRIALGSLLGLTVAICQAKEPLAITTASGSVVGISSGGIESWRGIPYAEPPVGQLRWQPPQPAKPWDTPLKANALASSCAQNADLGVFANAGGSEDCLYLNVYRSDAADNHRKRPVFVWIHGGALQVGAAGDYNPEKLARRGNAVIVTINYRLGLFGFLAHSALDDENHHVANYGLMDQQAALHWVQKNIALFGGDASNVTIAGESSGGNSVMAHMVSPRSAGLFQHVIAMSGGGIMTRHPAFGAPLPLSVAREVGNAFAKEAGCETGGANCLRALSSKRILDIQAPFALNEFIIDGKLIPEHPSDAYRKGNINRATLVSGSTRDEGRFFVALPELMTGKVMTETDYPIEIERMYGKALAPKVLRQYPLVHYDNPSEAFASAATNSMFACTGRAMNRALADKIPVYAYEFSDRTAPSYIDATSFPLLAAHTYELAYLFPGFHGGSGTPVKLNPLQEKLSDQMVDHFADVAALHTLPSDWPQFDPKQDNFMTFALPGARMVSGRFARAHHCEFWDRTGVY